MLCVISAECRIEPHERREHLKYEVGGLQWVTRMLEEKYVARYV